MGLEGSWARKISRIINEESSPPNKKFRQGGMVEFHSLHYPSAKAREGVLKKTGHLDETSGRYPGKKRGGAGPTEESTDLRGRGAVQKSTQNGRENAQLL